jgi:hypothetical protein
MLRCLPLVLVLLAAGPARADTTTETVAARPAAAAATPEAAFERAVDDHYDAIQDGRPCHDGCAQVIVRETKLGRGLALQLRRATATYGDVYAFVFGSGGHWWAAEPLDDIQQGDCGMGKCVSEEIRSVAPERAGGLLWIRVRVRVQVDHFDPKSVWVHDRDVVIGCKLGEAPTCASLAAGHAFTGGTAARRGDTVVIDDDNAGRRRVTIAF